MVDFGEAREVIDGSANILVGEDQVGRLVGRRIVNGSKLIFYAGISLSNKDYLSENNIVYRYMVGESDLKTAIKNELSGFTYHSASGGFIGSVSPPGFGAPSQPMPNFTRKVYSIRNENNIVIGRLYRDYDNDKTLVIDEWYMWPDFAVAKEWRLSAPAGNDSPPSEGTMYVVREAFRF